MEKARQTQIYKMNKAVKERREQTNVQAQIIGEDIIDQNDSNGVQNQQTSEGDQNAETGISTMGGDQAE